MARPRSVQWDKEVVTRGLHYYCQRRMGNEKTMEHFERLLEFHLFLFLDFRVDLGS